jgi:hypothetical protein
MDVPGQKDNRFYIPGYQGYVPKIKAENAFGQSFGKTSGASVNGSIQQGFIQTPEQKFQSINQSTYTNMHEQTKLMRPAEQFEPGYDSIYYVESQQNKPY